MNLLVFIIFSIVEVCRHVYLRKVKKRSPNKLLSFIIRSGAALAFVYIEHCQGFALYYMLPVYTITNWWIHDYLQNMMMRKRPIWYLNSTGPIDTFQNKYPNAYVWFFFKTIALIGLVGMYYLSANYMIY